jgi:hypothetical protein
MSKYRVDQYRVLQDAVERMQQAWNEPPVSKPTALPQDQMEQAPPQTLSDPGAVVQKFAQALDKNLQVGATHPQFAKALSRSADGKNKVVPPAVKSEPRADEWLLPGTPGLKRRRLVRRKKLRRRRSVEVDEETRDVDEEAIEREEVFEEGVDYVEYRARPAHEHPMTRIETDDEYAEEPEDDVMFDDEEEVTATNVPVPLGTNTTVTGVHAPPLTTEGLRSPHEKTRTDFTYTRGETHHDEWLRQHSQGVRVVKGEGARFVDRNVTQTVIRPKKPR